LGPIYHSFRPTPPYLRTRPPVRPDVAPLALPFGSWLTLDGSDPSRTRILPGRTPVVTSSPLDFPLFDFASGILLIFPPWYVSPRLMSASFIVPFTNSSKRPSWRTNPVVWVARTYFSRCGRNRAPIHPPSSVFRAARLAPGASPNQLGFDRTNPPLAAGNRTNRHVSA